MAIKFLSDIGLTGALSVSSTLTLSGLSSQSSEDTFLTINGSNQVGTREVDVDAFYSSGDTIAIANGSASAPSLTFASDSNTGLFRQAVDSVSFTTNGTETMRISSGNIFIPHYITHLDDGNTFFGFNAADSFTIRTGGTNRVTVANTQMSIGTPVAMTGVTAVTATSYAAVVIDGSGNLKKSNVGLGSNAFNSTAIPTDTVSSTDINTYFRRGYTDEEFKLETISAAGWYTIAVNTGSRSAARFSIFEPQSSSHQVVTFYAGHHYGTNESNTLTVLHNTSYGNNGRFSALRIKDGGVYEGAVLQVYVDGNCNATVAIHENVTTAGWTVKDWIPDATDPGGVTNYSSMAQRTNINLDNVSNGGIATTGPIYADGYTTQYKHWNTNTFDFSNLSNNRLVTAASASTLNGEANLTFNGTALAHTGNYVNNASASGQPNIQLTRASGVPSIKSSETNGYVIIDASGTGKVGINWYDDAGCTIGQGGGNLIVGTNTSNTEKLFVNGNCKVNTALGVGIAPNAQSGRIDASNDVVAFSTSDIRLKDNIIPIESSLDKVKKLQGIEFDWVKKEGVHGNEGHDVGVIAQQVEEVLPEVVTTRDSGYKAVKYEKIVPLLIEAIKELSEKLDNCGCSK
jgi:hypothetical protein